MLLIVDNKKTQVNYEAKTLVIRRDNQFIQRVPLNLLEQMIVYGKPDIDISVWWALAEHNIPAILLSTRSSKKPAILTGGLAVRLPLRRLQYRCAEHPIKAFLMAKWVLENKIDSYQLPLTLIKQQHLEQASGFIERCDMAYEALELAENINSLMGIEGKIAQMWFKLLRHALDTKWRFMARNRRPPRDPVNALLSLGYTLLSGDVRQVILSEGLDPAFGFLHQTRAGREALMLDLLEPFRSGVDLFAIGFLDTLEVDDFSYSDSQGCRLKKTKRGLFYAKWSQYRSQWPYLADTPNSELEISPIQEQIRGKVNHLRDTMEVHNEKVRS
jgi:CRISPR-associated protein Cas1